MQDTGAGIAPEEIDSIFEAFVQSKTGKEAQEGTGLGLPISYPSYYWAVETATTQTKSACAD